MTVKSRIIHSSDIARCPIKSLQPSHYRDNGVCQCHGDDYSRGFDFGRFIRLQHEEGEGGFDPRYAIAEEARTSVNSAAFKDYMNGLHAGAEPTAGVVTAEPSEPKVTKARCPYCLRTIALTSTGKLWTHKTPNGNRCSRSGGRPS